MSVVVLTAIPVEARPSRAERSFDKERVGLPDTPSPLEIEIPAAGPVSVLVV